MHLAMLNGEFKQATEREIIEEEIRVLELLDLDNVPFYGIHPTNTSSVKGMIPQDRNRMINQLQNYLATENSTFLNSSKERLIL